MYNETPQQMYGNLPFKNPNEKFADGLYDEYILKSINWIKKASGGVAFAQNYGSNWEAAYILEYLLDVRKIALYRSDNDCVLKNEEMCNDIVYFLLSDNEQTNWDDNTWDTSVVCNALLYYMEQKSNFNIANNNDHIEKLWHTLPEAIKWLYVQFDSNRSQYSQYAFGSVDYSRILMFFIYVTKSKYYSLLLKKAKLSKKSIINAIHSLAKHIDKEKIVKDDDIYDETERVTKKEKIINWGDCFITAEICDAISLYLNFLVKNKLPENNDSWIKKIYFTLKKAMRSVEITQSPEGMWGAHDDTIRCLSSYLTTVSQLKIFENVYLQLNNSIAPKWIRESDCEEHKVFKAIRWLFDPKQRFSDGSYLHTSFLSVFMFEAFISIYNHWDFAENKTIYKIYDEVFWMSPVRTTQEKGQVVELEIEQESKVVEIKKLKSWIRLFGLSFSVLSVIIIFFIICRLTGLLHIDFKISDTIPDVGEMMSLTFAITVFVITTVYLSKRGDD
jgi:hypothetical protein